MKRVLKPGILLMAVAGLAACGGGGGNNDETGNNNVALPVVSTVLDGVALDGYLRQAKVCLDLNDNLVCEAGEPATVTDSAGRYRLTAPSLDAANAHRVVVEVIAGQTTDADAPSTPIPNGYVLVAPVGRHGVISPITTLAYQLQADQPGLSLDEAAAQLRSLFALPGDVNLWADYAATNASADQQALHQLAQVLARASGTGLASIQTALGGTIADTSKRAATLVVWKQILDHSREIVDSLVAGATPSDIYFRLDDGNLTQQLAVASQSKSPVADSLSVVAGGLYVPSLLGLESGVIPYYGQVAVQTTAGGTVDTIWTPSYFDATTNVFLPYEGINDIVVLKSGRWTSAPSIATCRHSARTQGLHLSCGNGIEEDQRFAELSLADRGIDALLRYGLSELFANVWSVAPERVFSGAAWAYQVSGQTTEDLYILGWRVLDAQRQPYPDLDAFMAANQAGGQVGLRVASRLTLQFDTATGTSGALSLIETDAEGQNWQVLPLKGHWQRQSVGEAAMVLTTIPAAYYHYLGTNAFWRFGWTQYTPPGGAQAVYGMNVKVKGAPANILFFNTAAMDDLKAARGTAVPAS